MTGSSVHLPTVARLALVLVHKLAGAFAYSLLGRDNVENPMQSLAAPTGAPPVPLAPIPSTEGSLRIMTVENVPRQTFLAGSQVVHRALAPSQQQQTQVEVVQATRTHCSPLCVRKSMLSPGSSDSGVSPRVTFGVAAWGEWQE